MFTEEELKNSEEFKTSIIGRVALIHNVYYDSEGEPLYIVLYSQMGKWTIMRFWKSPNKKTELNKIRVKKDYQNISTEEAFKVLLSEYSRGLV